MNRPPNPVPRLNLAPKRKRPLSLWNPLDYLLLLYWVFFFPQALRWYVETFGNSWTPKEERIWQHFLQWRRRKPVERQLFVQGLIVSVVTPVLISGVLEKIGISIDWFGMVGMAMFSLVFSMLFGMVEDVAGSVALTVAGGVAGGLARGLIVDVLEDARGLMMGGVAVSLLMAGIVGGSVARVVEGGIAFRIVRSFSFFMALGMVFGLLGGMAFTVIFSLKGSVAFGIVFGLLGSVVLAVMFNLMVSLPLSVARFRPEIWLLSFPVVLLKPQNLDSYLPRITPLPVPSLTTQLKIWLRRDWETGLINLNDLLKYTLQFIPVVKAVNYVLAETSPQQLIFRVSQLAGSPYDWNLIRFSSASLGKQFKSMAVEEFFLLPYFWKLWNQRIQGYFPTDLRLDTHAHAAAAGFWYLHEGKPKEAEEAFAVVRSLPYGEEMFYLAQTLATLKSIEHLEEFTTLKFSTLSLQTLLRPITWNAISSFHRVIEDIKFVQRSVSRSARSLALNRALGELKDILDTIETVPEAERGLIQRIAEVWQEFLLEITGEIGEVSITKPVQNPYIIGDPVQGQLFVGRDDIIRELEELWILGNQLQSAVIFGHRRMGKTSILLNISNCLGAKIKIAYVNLLCLGNTTQGVGEVLMAICDAISDALKLPPPDDHDLLILPYRTFERYLQQIASNCSEGFIIALDEFEKIEELIEAEKIPKDFMGFLRGMVQKSPKIAFAFAGLHTLEEMTADYFQPFFASVIPIKVSFIERAATRYLLANPHEDFLLDYHPETLDRIYELTFGQPYLVQLVGFQLVRRYNDQVFEIGRPRDPVFTIDDVEVVINDPEFYQRGRYYFDGVWGQATQEIAGQHEIIKAIAPHPQGISFNTLTQTAGLDETHLQDILNVLQRHDVVTEKQGHWYITVELFRRWVLQHHP